jgi:hypothetical protein
VSKELKLERRKCWLIWVILSSGTQALRAVCLSREVADAYVEYAKKLPKVERVMAEPSITDHLYFGAFEFGAQSVKDIKAALKRAKAEYSVPAQEKP